MYVPVISFRYTMDDEEIIYNCLDGDGLPIKDQWTLEPLIRKYKYMVKIILITGRERILYADEPEAARVYVKKINAKIRWVKKL